MSDTANDVAERLDGTTPVAPNQTVMFDGENVPVWRPVTLYRTVTDSQDRNVPRTNLPAAQPWNTPSTLDQATVLAEDLTIVYRDPQGGRWPFRHDHRTVQSAFGATDESRGCVMANT